MLRKLAGLRRRERPHSFADGVRGNRRPHAEDLADVAGVARTASRARTAFADVNRCVYDSPAGDDRQRQFKRQRRAGRDPVSKISIIARNRGALGYTMQMPREDRYLVSLEELGDHIAIMMGGRAAEQLMVGTISTGAVDDIHGRRSSRSAWSPKPPSK